MTHVTPKDIVIVQYLGKEPTKVRPFLMGDKVDVKKGDKVEMDARQAATVLIDHLNWEKIGEKKADPKDGSDQEEKPKAKKSK